MHKKLDDETKDLLKSIVDHFDNEDIVVRQAQLRHYRRLKLYWNSFTNIYWDEGARDYRIAAADDLAYSGDDQEYYDRPINVFRAFLETIIAALAIQIPSIICVPDDADNPNDTLTAKAGDRISQLIYKHNDVILLWLTALYIHCTEGMVACYTYADESEKYGTYPEKEFKDEEVESFVCPHCQAQMDEAVFTGQLNLFNEQQQQQLAIEAELKNQEALNFSQDEENEFAPDENDVELHNQILNKGPVCPECGSELDPNLQKTKLIVPRFVGMNNKPKSRICMKVYGGLYIKVANYAKCQADTPYLIHSYETHYANAMEEFPDLRDEIPQGGWSNTGINDPYAQYARLNPQYRNAFPEEQVTIRHAWLRPAAYNILTEEQSKKIRKLFPDGCKVSLVNTVVCEAENENLDDCWTLTKNPLHDYLNHDALGELLVNVQDIVSDLISLTLQTIEHGIIQTWADPAVVNFEAQSQISAQPGTITPTKLQGGSRNIGEAFHSTQAARLAPETFQFYQIVNQLGQFVSAAMPSIFGGSQESGSSRTASEYAMSRTASLQRLQTPWRMFTVWWKEIFGKAIPAYIKLVKTDERYVRREDSGDFINVWIRKSELAGKIGSVELEAAEQMPVSDEQKADVVMRLMELNNMEIMAALTSPENLPFIRKVVKMPEFKLPGEDDRIKQLEEIKELISSQPVEIPPDPMMVQEAIMSGDPNLIQSISQPIQKPSIEPDILVDNHQVEADICRGWLVSEAGRLTKRENPPGYMNVLLHMKAHLDIVNQQMMAQMQMQAANPQTASQGAQSPKPKGSSEIKENRNVRTPIGE